MWVITTKAQALIEDFQKDTKDGITAITAIGLAVDVEQQYIGLIGGGARDIGSQHRVSNFSLEKIDGPARFAVFACLFSSR